MAVSPAATPRIGRKQFPITLPLADKEVVLTFDDGPLPSTTGRILDALQRECVRATFFLVGRHAEDNPALVQRELSEGHTVGHHTYSHPVLTGQSLAAADQEIERGISAIEAAAGEKLAGAIARTFFRFPGFASSPALLDKVAARGLIVFGADLWGSDWNAMTPSRELLLVMNRLEESRGGILLLHDTKEQTAAMIPFLLRELRAREYRIVHVVPATE
jgi:peptidoglycan/xylan/chitin deacetylase (PgdA/CDA1 family)